MRIKIADWLDSKLGLCASSEAECALLEERFFALTRQLPWLYGILFANLAGLHVALRHESIFSNVPAIVLLAIIVVRGVRWLRLRSQHVEHAVMQREMRKAFLLTSLFCVGCAAWTINLYSTMFNHSRVDVTMFASLAAIGFAYGMGAYPASARVPLLLLSIPLAVMLSSGPEPSHIGLGICLVLLSALTLRMIDIQDVAFRHLVTSRIAVEVERRRAVEAERVAVNEKCRVGIIANTDPLTGLSNRRGFLAALDRVDTGQRMALVLLDLDGFKPINDTFGHGSGDQLLVEVGHRLQGLAGQEGAIARLGGDEFAIIVECCGEERALAFAKRVVRELGEPFEIEGRSMVVTACAGVSVQPGDELSDAVRRSDIALYAAKQSGRSSVVAFSGDMEHELQRRTSIEQALRDPDLARSVDLAFQPIFELNTMKLVAFEALARWRHSELGWIPPSEFIPLTEQMNVLEDLSNELLKRAAATARQWPNSVRLSFNLSAVQLCTNDSAAKILQILASERLAPSRLQMEVTETAFLTDFALARQTLSELRDNGIRIVLDDFGAGFSSISYLREMNFDAVKLDGSLILPVTRAGTGRPLLKGVLALCREMGQECVAEQIEDQSQLDLLCSLGCRYGQGYWLSRPIDSQSAARLANAAGERRTAA